ncbi:hypothetical protein K7432_013269 [Basidiobolus ranarum]|uniref:Methyltransferase domain-containing protein n=1 Tax=Basidiobolus ranarum TaxID=34480 RepID=A0ABR2WJL2_9FUNG
MSSRLVVEVWILDDATAKSRVMEKLSTSSESWDCAASDTYISIIAPRLALFARDAMFLADPKDDDILLEVACGPGHLAIEAARAGVKKIIATDWSKAMLDGLKNTLKQESPKVSERVTPLHVDGQTLQGIDENSVDIAISLFGIFLFNDRTAACNSLMRVVKPGGKVIVSLWDSQKTEPSPTMFSVINTLVTYIKTNSNLANNTIPSTITDKDKMLIDLEKAGFVNIRSVPVSHSFCFADSDTLLKYFMGRNPVFDRLFLTLDEQQLEGCRRALIDEVYGKSSARDKECVMNGVAYMIIAEKPDSS